MQIRIRWKLILLILPTALIPLIAIISFSIIRVFAHLEDQQKIFYSTLLGQVRENIDFVYTEHYKTLQQIINLPTVVKGLTAPPYANAGVEEEVNELISGSESQEGGLRAMSLEKLDGALFVYELDRESIIDGTDYKIHYGIDMGSAFLFPPTFEMMIDDPLFTKLKQDPDIQMIFGKFKPGTIKGIGGDDKPAMIMPWYQDGKTEFSKLVVVLLHPAFLADFYKDIDDLQFGTLYVLDRFNNMISYNHPNVDDYYEYDEEKMEYYMEEGDDPDDPWELLSFKEYQLLVTDQAILETPEVDRLIDIMDREEFFTENEDGSVESVFDQKISVTFKGQEYLVVLEYSDLSKTKFIYFHPVNQIQKPIFDIIKWLVIVTGVIIIIIVLIGIVYSKTFTDPIKNLVAGTEAVGKGDYSQFVDVQSTDEIGELSENFNQMIKHIQQYQDKMVTVEREKTELDLAAKIQTSLLPPVHDTADYEIQAVMRCATEVGGDYYEIIGEHDGRIWFGIGDVSGHGLTSGLIMMMAQTAFNTILHKEPDIPTSELLAHVNSILFQNIKKRLGEDHFMTLSFMVAEPDGTIRHAGAHLDILVYRAKTGKVERVETSGIWLGLVPDILQMSGEQKFKLESGDFMFLYTDGLIEAKNSDDEQYDLGRLIDILEKNGTEELPILEDIVLKDVYQFLNEQDDDITFLVARKK
jgi:serine phosphatase RsbU (regulator of sigma subunit)